jgi:hypothetical protein
MNSKALIGLVSATVAAVAAALLVTMKSDKTAPAEARGRLFEALPAHVNDVTSITVKKAGKEFTVQRQGEGAAATWGIVEKGGYPVQFEKVKQAVVGVSELRLLEPKTSKPENYAKIQVQDPADQVPPGPPGAEPMNPIKITLKDGGGQVLASAIVGKSEYGTRPSVFVRRAGEPQSWLAEGQVQVEGEPTTWLETQILNIGKERIKSVTVIQPSAVPAPTAAATPAAGAEAPPPPVPAASVPETLIVDRQKPEDTVFNVEGLPAGRELKYPGVADQLAAGLSYFNLEDVAPADQVDLTQKPGATAEFRSFDGMLVTVRMGEKDGKTWAKLAAAYEEPPAAADAPKPDAANPEPPAGEKKDEAKPEAKKDDTKKSAEDVKKEVADLNTKLGKWAYAVQAYKATSLASKMSDMLKDPPAPATPPVPGSQPGGAPWEQGMPPAGAEPPKGGG